METIEVKIGEQTYTLRCEEPERARKLAHRLDTMMRQMKQRNERISTVALAVLAALNVLEEYDIRCEQLANQIEAYDRELAKMQEFLHECLRQAQQAEQLG